MHELRAEGMSFEEIMADPVGHLGEEARALVTDPRRPNRAAQTPDRCGNTGQGPNTRVETVSGPSRGALTR